MRSIIVSGEHRCSGEVKSKGSIGEGLVIGGWEVLKKLEKV